MPKAAALVLLLCLTGLLNGCRKITSAPDTHDITLNIKCRTEYLQYNPEIGLYDRSQLENMDFRYVISVYKSLDGVRFSREEHMRIVRTSDVDPAEKKSIVISVEEGIYRFYIWGDYVPRGSVDDCLYTTNSFESISVSSPYPHGTEYKDAFIGMADYGASDAASGHSLDVVLERPVAQYKLVSTDLERFRTDVIRDGETIEDYSVKISYRGWLNTCFNAFLGEPGDSETGITYESGITALNENEAEIAFDYIFAPSYETSAIVDVEVYDRSGNLVSRSIYNEIPLMRNCQSVVKGNDFLTSSDKGGIGVDSGFDGETNIPLD